MVKLRGSKNHVSYVIKYGMVFMVSLLNFWELRDGIEPAHMPFAE